MEKIDRRNTDCCSMNHSNLLELDGYYVCSKCGRCQSDRIFTSASTNLKSNIEKSSNIYDICENGGIPQRTAYIANNLFIHWRKKMPRLNLKKLEAAAVYISCKEDGYPRSLREISNISGINPKQIGRYETIMHKKHHEISPDIYINRFCRKLGKKFDFIKKAFTCVSALHTKNKANPITSAASAIYLAHQMEDKDGKKILLEIQNLTGVSPSTILRTAKK